MANPVDRRLDGPDGTTPSGGAPDPHGAAGVPGQVPPPRASQSAARLPTRVPFAGPHPGSTSPGSTSPETPFSEPAPPARPAARRRTTPANLFLRSTRVPNAAEDVPDVTASGGDGERVPPVTPAVTAPTEGPAGTGRPRNPRVRIVSGAAVAAVLVAGSLFWSGTRSTGETTPAAAPETATATATAPITVPATGGAPDGTGTGSGSPSAGPSSSGAATPGPSRRPVTQEGSATASPPGPKASVNTSGRNLALNSTVTASSVEHGAWAASNAVDGDPSTRWSSGFSDPQWLRVDLGARWQISEIKLNWENAHATAYRVDVSVDGTAWKSVYHTSSGRGGTVVVEVAKLPARFVRVYGTKRSTDYGYSLLEIAVR
ncbi:discoidin domain-containing protein [Micromonospora sp. NPDC050397]|uniref:discoidin domain-containing protein n=1 Tax=Micromonospora sp. NPDC050397 TaxID=3364279 RepID=UPI00384D4203